MHSFTLYLNLFETQGLDNSNFNPIIGLGLFFIVLILIVIADRGLFTMEKTWDNVSDQIYDPTTESNDPFAEFTGLDQSVIQVVTDTKLKFEDVAGNEEAK